MQLSHPCRTFFGQGFVVVDVVVLLQISQTREQQVPNGNFKSVWCYVIFLESHRVKRPGLFLANAQVPWGSVCIQTNPRVSPKLWFRSEGFQLQLCKKATSIDPVSTYSLLLEMQIINIRESVDTLLCIVADLSPIYITKILSNITTFNC